MNLFSTISYNYLGDRMTDPALKGATCTAVRRTDGKCVRGRNGSMLLFFKSGRVVVVIGRLLRKVVLEEKTLFMTEQLSAKLCPEWVEGITYLVFQNRIRRALALPRSIRTVWPPCIGPSSGSASS